VRDISIMDSTAASSDAVLVDILDRPDERAGDEFLDEADDVGLDELEDADDVDLLADASMHEARLLATRLEEKVPSDASSEDDSKRRAEDEITRMRSHAQPHRLKLELMQKIAIERGGKCLSSIYKNLNEKLEWQCCDGHTWPATPRNIRHSKSWCPTCRGNVGEELVRATLIEAFPGKTFERTRRVEWLGRLELDGYNPELKLAFEYQGIQHFEHVAHFQREEGQFESQLERDARKRELCEQAGVVLLEVSYKVKLNDVRLVVRKMLVDLKFTIANASMTDDAFYNMSRAGSYSNVRLELAKKIAIEKGGVCLAAKYISYDFKMPFKCGQGHEFKASLQDINQDVSRGPRFCPVCGGTQKKSDDEIRDRVEAIGYRLINTFSKKSGDRDRPYLTVQCPENHKTYDVEMNNLINGDGSLNKGCSDCGHEATGASKRSDIAAWSKETGINIVGKYINGTKVSTWKCSRGHIFDVTFIALKLRKHKCRSCYHNDS
jgi:hypothetical protein